jgi:hypothetical protein
MRAALSGLVGWKELQIILTKNPVDQNGNSLVPDGLDIRVVRYFPLAQVLSAFDGAIAATGYNSVHELLPAEIPTVFISNIRGTDDQDARAQWCHDKGFALRADHANLENITETVQRLQSEQVRSELRKNCAALSNTNGGKEIAELLVSIANDAQISRESLYLRILRKAVVRSLYLATRLYRWIKPQSFATNISTEATVFSSETSAEFLRDSIKGSRRFEQLITNPSKEYLEQRKAIAARVYKSEN